MDIIIFVLYIYIYINKEDRKRERMCCDFYGKEKAATFSKELIAGQRNALI